MDNTFIANLIYFLHILFIGFLIIIPFTKYTGLLFLHLIFVPFIFFHWITNNNTCVLTTLEKKIRKFDNEEDEKKESFTYNLINPIFKFTNEPKSALLNNIVGNSEEHYNDNNKNSTLPEITTIGQIDEYINVFSYCILILLGTISLSKLIHGYQTKKIVHLFDLFFIDKHI